MKKKVNERFNKATFSWIILALVGLLIFNYLFGARILRKSHEIAIISILINIMLAASLNLILGVAGQFSLGHAGFMSIGAYCVAIVLRNIPGYLGFALGIGLGLIVTTIVSLIVAIPTLRLKGDYLAIATLGVAEIIRITITNLGDLTGGAVGISNIERIPTFNMIYVFTIITLAILSMLRNSRFGRSWNGILEDEIASSAMGINITNKKVSAFLIGALMASVAGAIYASYFTIIQPGLFNFNMSVDILVIVVLGGLGSFTGTVLSASVIGLINLVFQNFAEERIIIYSILLIVMMIFKPGGFLGKEELSFRRIWKRGKKNVTT
ncbi:MAG: branched-chain amino acid ABC transporter permease [Erysipelothrix sp.]|nr:branched-chain amino acid ABC transporter permease [Erysipelothrix sp.]